jgi:hypothetical protein
MPTAEQLCQTITDALPELAPFQFRASYKGQLGNHEHLHVTFAMVKKGAGELDSVNAKKQVMISILAAPGYEWPIGAESPAKLIAHQFRGRNMKFRKKTGDAKAIVKAIVDFFAVHGPYTLPEGK